MGSGFRYKTVPHITLKSIANNEPPGTETLYDQPLSGQRKKPRQRPVHGGGCARPGGQVGGGPAARRDDAASERKPPPMSPSPAPAKPCARANGATSCCAPAFAARRASRSALPGWSRCPAAAGCTPTARRAPATKARIQCARQAPPTTLSASSSPSARSTPRWNSARWSWPSKRRRPWCPSPRLIVFAAFQFDPEAAKDIDETKWPGVTLLKAQMNADLLTDDLKKKRASNESFWLIGQPDVALRKIQRRRGQGQVGG